MKKEQLRAGRNYLQVSIKEFCNICNIGYSTMTRLESGFGSLDCNFSTLEKINIFFQERGIEFETQGNEIGIKYNPENDKKKSEEGRN